MAMRSRSGNFFNLAYAGFRSDFGIFPLSISRFRLTGVTASLPGKTGKLGL